MVRPTVAGGGVSQGVAAARSSQSAPAPAPAPGRKAPYRLAGRHNGSGIVDVTIGDNTFTALDDNGNPLFTVPGFQAVRGYDMASGLGTVDAYAFAHQLAKRGGGDNR
jgi:hypothetical protein